MLKSFWLDQEAFTKYFRILSQILGSKLSGEFFITGIKYKARKTGLKT